MNFEEGYGSNSKIVLDLFSTVIASESPSLLTLEMENNFMNTLASKSTMVSEVLDLSNKKHITISNNIPIFRIILQGKTVPAVEPKKVHLEIK